ncbi:MAG: hypothetical protein PUG16_00385 [Lachnospiraceae bacterium]|nr:hypothetical protein [Lachnospiraceae bacterium]
MMNRNHNMKRNIERLAAGALAAAVGFGTVACGAAGTSSKSSSKDTLKATKEKLEDTMEVSTSFGDKADEDAEKIETVYVSADADGSAKDVTVSNWLRNYSGQNKIEDKSDLTDIKNVKGNQKYEKGSDGALTWDADGKDVFYQGKTKDTLPVGVKVSYKLDGQDIDAKDLAGKSGKVTIRFDYTNTAKTTVNVDGQDKEMTVPFAMISGMVLPSDHFSNITVTNGKVVSDADNNIVMGVALPGLSDALSIDRSKLDELGVDSETTIPDYVEITADAKDFELGLTMTMASANVLSDLGFSDYDNSDAVNKIGDDMDKLQSSMQQLIDGGQKISDGTKSLKEGSAALKDGVNAYTGGVSQLTAGAKKLNDSISTLTDGTQKLSDGVKLLKQKLSQAKSSKDVQEIQSLYQTYLDIYNQLKNPNGDFAKAVASVGSLTGLQTEKAKLQDSVNGFDATTPLYQQALSEVNSLLANKQGELIKRIKAGYQEAYKKATLQSKDLSDDEAKMILSYAMIQEAQELQQSKQTLTLSDLQSDAFQKSFGEKVTQAVQAYLMDNLNHTTTVRDKVSLAGDNTQNALNKAIQDQVSAQVKDAYQQTVAAVKATINTANPGMQDSEQSENAELITKIAIKNAMDKGEIFNSAFMKQGGKFQTLYLVPAAETLSGMQTNVQKAQGITKAEAENTEPKTRGYENIKSENDLSQENKAWLAATGMTKTEWTYLSIRSRITDDKAANTGAEYLVKYNAFMTKFAMIQSAYNSVQSKLSELSMGVDQLDSGASQLLNGISKQLAPGVLQLYNGAAKLNSNSAALNKGASELYEGAGQLADGSATLSDGLVQFNDEGIAKLSEAFTGEVSQFADQLKAVDDAGKSYTTFSGKADDMNSSVKFIIETDEISKDSKK